MDIDVPERIGRSEIVNANAQRLLRREARNCRGKQKGSYKNRYLFRSLPR
jgi:hypothetical protein